MPKRHIPFPIAILAGGSSSRMGRDKAMVRVGGIPMLHRIVATACRLSDRVVIVGREKPARWPAGLPVQFLPDVAMPTDKRRNDKSSSGPLVGLLAALEHVCVPLVLLACDVPFVSPALLRKLAVAHKSIALATMAANGEDVEPTLAIYSPRLLPTLRHMLADNRRALYSLAGVRGVTTWQIPLRHVPELLNVNDPPSLKQARSFAARSVGAL